VWYDKPVRFRGEIVKKELIVLLVLLSLLPAIGFAAGQGEVSNNTPAPVTVVTPNTTAPGTLTVYAAASLTDAFTEIADRFEMENPGTNVTLNFGSSGDLRMQIEGGAPVDVFASADEAQMNILANESLIDNATREDFASNALVLIVPANGTLNITSVQNLTNPEVQKIAIGNPDTVPVGNYTRTALTEVGLWNQIENKTIPAEDVRQTLTYVEKGEVDAGFVYLTDANAAEPGTVKIIENVSVSTPITYPIAIVSSSQNEGTAQNFNNMVSGSEGQAILASFGFIPSPIGIL
jgi:molybdate transport system substrate-binding protein